MSGNPLDPHWALYPRTYSVPRAPYTFPIDGDLTKDVWTSTTTWSEPFRDITGTDSDNVALTQFKALWDDDYLYIGALLHPSPDFNTQAHFTQRNSPIYQQDSDFEVFLDVLGCNHNYKELEINALNTVWNLLLDKPYRDGGAEHSGRIAKPGEANYYDVTKQRSAVRILRGRLNDPNGQGALWSVELALSFADVMARYAVPVMKPTVGTLWRINFSRVELQGQINWTWQKQVIWDAELKRHIGKVDMHLPDAWGYLLFVSDATKKTNEQSERDLLWPARLTTMNVYYALHHYKDQHGCYTDNLAELSVDEQLVAPFDIVISVKDDSFLVTVRDGNVDVTVLADRLLRVIDRTSPDSVE